MQLARHGDWRDTATVTTQRLARRRNPLMVLRPPAVSQTPKLTLEAAHNRRWQLVARNH